MSTGNLSTGKPAHSLAEIQSAIEALMARLSGGRATDASLAGRIAGNILPTVNDPRNPIEVLTGPAFDRLVIEQAPKLAETVNDPAAQLAAARAEEARANISGAPLSDAARAALYGNNIQGGGSSRMASSDKAESGSARGSTSLDVGSITEATFHGSSLEKMGLSLDSFKAMRREGFDNAQITSAVTTNTALGIKANDNPAATARLQRDTPWAVESLQESHDALKEANSCDEKAKQAAAKGDTAGAEHWRRQGDAKRQQEAERHRRTHDRLGREKPERQHDYDNRHQRMLEGLRGITTGNKIEDKATFNIVENYRRHPEDAEARHNYEALNKKLSADPRRKLAMAEIDRTLHEGQKAEVAELKKNEGKISENDDKRLAEAKTNSAIADADDEMANLIAKPVKAVRNSVKPAEQAAVKKDYASRSKIDGAKEKTADASVKPAPKKASPTLA